jgi:hypothetical protein
MALSVCILRAGVTGSWLRRLVLEIKGSTILLCILSAGFQNLVFRRTGFGWGMGWIRRSALVGRAIRHLTA